MSPAAQPQNEALVKLQLHLQRVYGLAVNQTPDIRPFLVDDDALEAIRPHGAERPADEWVLVHEREDGLDLAVWIDPAHLDALERAPDLRSAVRLSLRSFCAVVEGISHFMLLIERARRGEPLTLLELEVQAEIDKFVSASLHCPDREPALRRALYDDVHLQHGLSEAERSRYREAGRLARGWSEHLGRQPHLSAILREQRRLWHASGVQRMERLRAMAA